MLCLSCVTKNLRIVAALPITRRRAKSQFGSTVVWMVLDVLADVVDELQRADAQTGRRAPEAGRCQTQGAVGSCVRPADRTSPLVSVQLPHLAHTSDPAVPPHYYLGARWWYTSILHTVHSTNILPVRPVQRSCRVGRVVQVLIRLSFVVGAAAMGIGDGTKHEVPTHLATPPPPPSPRLFLTPRPWPRPNQTVRCSCCDLFDSSWV